MDFSQLSPLNAAMEYRRFGKTEKKVSVITLGGMRYKNVWEEPRHEIPADTLVECRETVRQAFDYGINMIETAYGYTKSETLYGKVLNQELNKARGSYLLMTKGHPKSAEATRRMLEEQLKDLQTDYIDFYAWHGINTQELLETACAPGGPVEELLRMKDEGIIGHVGFSTHAPLDVIIRAIETRMFDFINLHYYYFFQRNKAAIDLAECYDMGVFIISPNDKGGQLYNPPPKLSQLTAPLHPLQWNARFCLSHPAIHTLTFGLPKTAGFDQLRGIFPLQIPLSPTDALIKHRLDEQLLSDPYSAFDGYSMQNDPSGINIAELLRLRRLALCYDMESFARYRYNAFEGKGHWVPGAFPTSENMELIDLSRCPKNIPLRQLIQSTHEALYIDRETKKQ